MNRKRPSRVTTTLPPSRLRASSSSLSSWSLSVSDDPAAPPLPWMRESVWRVLRWPPTKAGSLVTLGMLPAVLRERLGVEWTSSSERRFRALARVVRASRPLMPPPAREFGRYYLRWRREAIAGGVTRTAEETLSG